MTAVLSVRGLTVRYGGLVAVDAVDLDVPAGGIVGLIGPNGAGKTTCIDALTGFIPMAAGVVRLDGDRIDGLGPHDRAQRGLVRTFQSLELFDDLTVRENLMVAAARPRWTDAIFDAFHPRRPAAPTTSLRSRVESTLSTMGIASVADLRPDELANGPRHLVALARALVARPRLVLLDEPAAGLDPTETAQLADRLRALPAAGIAVLLVDHDMSLVFNTCDSIAVLDFGRVIATGAASEIRRDPAVIAAYLGTSSQ